MWLFTATVQVRTHRRIAQMKAQQMFVEPESGIQMIFFRIIDSSLFESGLLLCIIANAAFMSLEHYNMSDSLNDLMETANLVFTIIFTVEAIFKIIGLGWRPYFRSRWNLFDFVVVAVTLIGLASVGFSASVLRILRVARLFRVAKSLHGLRMLFETLIVSLPSLANVGGLMVLMMVVYAILGVNLFGKIQLGENLNTHTNFRSFGAAMLTLMRMTTGEAWNSIMYDAMRVTGCDSHPDCEMGECCGNPFSAVIYFSSFTVIGSFVMLNLLIAVVLENFSTTKKADSKKVNQLL